MLKWKVSLVLASVLVAMTCRASAQIPLGSIDGVGQKPTVVSPITQPTVSQAQLTLLELEGRFAQDVANRGGKAFASWFAEDGVTLSNGQLPIRGRAAIAEKANWNPKEYQLTWVPEGAQMGPSNDMGFTWGHYEGRSKDKKGQSVVLSGRYITVWKKVGNDWKVVLDASADEPPKAGECCVLPKP